MRQDPLRQESGSSAEPGCGGSTTARSKSVESRQQRRGEATISQLCLSDQKGGLASRMALRPASTVVT
jgi:hypothetical protein